MDIPGAVLIFVLMFSVWVCVCACMCIFNLSFVWAN